MILILLMITGTAFASIIIQGNMQIKLNVGNSSSGESVPTGALLKEDGGQLLKEDGGGILYD